MAELAALFRRPKGGPIEKVASNEMEIFRLFFAEVALVAQFDLQ